MLKYKLYLISLYFFRDAEVRKNREVAQLKKATRQHESKIKNLETEKRIKDTILKRKQEEVNIYFYIFFDT